MLKGMARFLISAPKNAGKRYLFRRKIREKHGGPCITEKNDAISF